MSTNKCSDVSPEFDPHTETYELRYDQERSTSVATALVFTLSHLTGDEPGRMLPLNRAVDPDVLEQHVDGRDRGARLSFEFHGYDVTVRDSGHIALSPLEGDSSTDDG